MNSVQAGKAEGRMEGKREGRLEVKAEFVLDLLENPGEIPDGLRKKILSEFAHSLLKNGTQKRSKPKPSGNSWNRPACQKAAENLLDIPSTNAAINFFIQVSTRTSPVFAWEIPRALSSGDLQFDIYTYPLPGTSAFLLSIRLFRRFPGYILPSAIRLSFPPHPSCPPTGLSSP